MATDANPTPAALGSLPKAEFAFPGPLRDQLVAAVLDGSKTSTTGLVVDYEHEGEPLPEVGRREVVVDSRELPVAVIEVTGVRVVPLAEVDLAHAVDEGEGYTSVAEWRAGHERFWHGEEMRAALGDPEFTVDDATPAVLERFRLVTVLPGTGGR
ncbi:ASCH domain-containing protein [Streptomyces sp. BBFR51]|uniref:ASCH domain-containing protein n=1 Tax=Streptomyces sp. BBFR51 TaxID=3372856 RepID=UPI0037DDADC1